MTEGLPPVLVLTIDADHPLRADQVAQIFDRLARDFRRFQRRGGRGKGGMILRLSDVRSGSIIAKIIAVVDAANTLAENTDLLDGGRNVLAGFYNQIFDTFQILVGQRRGSVYASDRSTIDILAAPVAKDNARQVSLQLFGDNSRVFIITSETLELINSEVATSSESLAEPRSEDRTEIASIKKRISNLLAADKLGPSAAEYINSHRDGTLVSVDGEWYVRYLGGEGAMVPLRGSMFDQSTLDPQQRYTVRGEILKSHGEVTGFRADTIIKPATGRG